MIIGITFSAFDLLHAGHVAMLRESKQRCNYLIVGLHADPSLERKNKNKPVQSLFERYVQLQGCKYVDEIIPYAIEAEISDILLTYPIDIRFIGEEYKDKDFTAKELCKQQNIIVYYNKRQHSFSSSALRQRIGHSNATIIRLKKEIQ
jgi:glycerol-3-phosphate cytidylyltransferase